MTQRVYFLRNFNAFLHAIQNCPQSLCTLVGKSGQLDQNSKLQFPFCLRSFPRKKFTNIIVLRIKVEHLKSKMANAFTKNLTRFSRSVSTSNCLSKCSLKNRLFKLAVTFLTLKPPPPLNSAAMKLKLRKLSLKFGLSRDHWNTEAF